MNEHEKNDDVERLIRTSGRRTPVPDDVATRVRAIVHEAWKSEIDAQRTRRRFMLSVPLAAAAALAVILYLTPSRRPDGEPTTAITVALVERTVGDVRLGQTVATASARVLASTQIVSGEGRAALRMSDGTSVRIDSQTQVRIDTTRQVLLNRGAIYVDAAHSGMSIRTPFGVVRDIGTRFEVRVTPVNARVRVRDGEIAIGEHHARRGEQLEVNASGQTTTMRIVTWGDGWTWLNEVSPGFAVEGKPVAEFVTWFAAESGMEVRYDSTSTSRKATSAVLHGSIGTLPPVAAVDAVLPTAGLRGDVKNGVLTVRQQ